MQQTCDTNEVVLQYAEPVFRFCMRRLADTREAEDLSQEILLEVLRGLRRPHEVASVSAWVWAIARNRYARRMQHRHGRSSRNGYGTLYACAMDMHVERADPSQPLLDRQEADEVFRALGSLAASYREILVLFYVRGLSYAAIAERLSISPDTVKWRLHHGRAKLKGRMDGEMHSPTRVYEPIEFTIACNGFMDPNKYLETQVARSIVSVAYEKPLTVEEIGTLTGLPCLYIEDEMNRLLYGEAVTKVGSKFATNFIITRLSDHARMVHQFAPLVAGVAGTLMAQLSRAEEAIRAIGFQGSRLPLARLLWILLPMAVRTAVDTIQQSDEKLQHGAYPPRRDGGKGWFIVREGRPQDYGDDSGRNGYFSPGCGVRAYYYWVARHFSQDLNRFMRALMGESDEHTLKSLLLGARGPDAGTADSELVARLVEFGILTRVGGALELAVVALSTGEQEALHALLSPVSAALVPHLSTLVANLWSDYRRHNPERLHDQVNQYLAGYVNSIIGMVATDLEGRGTLEAPRRDAVHIASLMFVYEG